MNIKILFEILVTQNKMNARKIIYLASPFDEKKDSRSNRLIKHIESKKKEVRTFFFKRKHKNALLNRVDMYISFFNWLNSENIEKKSNIITGNAEYTIIARAYSLIKIKSLNIKGDIHDNHAYIFTGITSNIYYIIESIALLACDLLILPSLKRKSQYPKLLTKYMSLKFIEISNSGFTPLDITKNNLNKKSRDVIKITYAGTIDYGRMIEDLIELGKRPDLFNIEIYGDGPLLKNSPQLFTANYKGKFNFSQLYEIYNNTDYIYACYSAKVKNNMLAQPNKLREVFEFNKPIITNTGTLFSDAVTKYECGIVLDFEDKDAVFKKIVEFIKNSFQPNIELFNTEIESNIQNAEKILG